MKEDKIAERIIVDKLQCAVKDFCGEDEVKPRKIGDYTYNLCIQHYCLILAHCKVRNSELGEFPIITPDLVIMELNTRTRASSDDYHMFFTNYACFDETTYQHDLHQDSIKREIRREFDNLLNNYICLGSKEAFNERMRSS